MSSSPIPRRAHPGADYGALATAFDGAIAIIGDAVRPLRAQITELQTENARLKAALAEARSKVAEIGFVVERLRVENKGPPGAKGERGRDGETNRPDGARRASAARRGKPHP